MGQGKMTNIIRPNSSVKIQKGIFKTKEKATKNNFKKNFVSEIGESE